MNDAASPSASRVPAWTWGLLAVVIALIPVRDAFDGSRLFFVRDLSGYWWPLHLWARNALLNGDSLLWDPWIGFGQSAIAEPNRLILFPPVAILRAVLPSELGFNLAVATPFPVAAAGTYLFLRLSVSRPASAFGAIVFCLSGPMLSAGNMINNSWSAALIPWTLLGVHRLCVDPCVRTFSLLAALVALHVLAGEPVTFAAAAALAGGYAVFAIGSWGWQATARRGLVTVLAFAAGLLIAAPQLLPLIDAVPRSIRGNVPASDTWPIHPLALLETVGHSVFGDPLAPWTVHNPWPNLLNAGRGPYLFSLYIGAGTLCLALLGVLAHRNRRLALFWCSAGTIATLCALGSFTPFYTTVQSVVPAVKTFRFPAKYAYEAAFCCSVLAAYGWADLRDSPPWTSRRLVAIGPVCVLMLAAAAAILAPAASAQVLIGLVNVDDSEAAAALASALPAASLGIALVSALAVVCILITTFIPSRNSIATATLFVVLTFDLLAANGPLNPTLESELMAEPPWIAETRRHPGDRIYVGGRAAFAYAGTTSKDAPGRALVRPDVSAQAVTAAYNSIFCLFPSAWRIREGISNDQAALWPFEYWRMLRQVSQASDESRVHYLRSTGVRYYLAAEPPSTDAQALVTLPSFRSTALYDGPEPTPRVLVVEHEILVPSTDSQTAVMLDPYHDPADSVVLAATPPAPSGRAGLPQPKAASIIEDSPTSVLVEADVPGDGGYLVLCDSYDPHWTAEVDEQSSPILRANGLFRAVRLEAGRHVIRFSYRSRPFTVGLIVSGSVVLVLLALNLVRLRHERSDSTEPPSE